MDDEVGIHHQLAVVLAGRLDDEAPKASPEPCGHVHDDKVTVLREHITFMSSRSARPLWEKNGSRNVKLVQFGSCSFLEAGWPTGAHPH